MEGGTKHAASNVFSYSLQEKIKAHHNSRALGFPRATQSLGHRDSGGFCECCVTLDGLLHGIFGFFLETVKSRCF